MYIHPRPYQKPHPPVWLMSNTPRTYALAGTEGMNVIGMSAAPGEDSLMLERLPGGGLGRPGP